MSKPIIHICAPGSPATMLLQNLRLNDVGGLIQLVQKAVGDRYRVRGRAELIDAPLDESKGGRNDDRGRARELQQSLADDNVAAVVTLRGGSWLTRVLPEIDFGVLARRRRPVAVFGFSEITTLVNIVGSYPMGRGYYDLGPAFLRSGLERYARLNIGRVARGRKLSAKAAAAFAARWAEERFEARFIEYFRDVVSIIEGRGSSRRLQGTLAAGRLPARTATKVVGGCLSLVTPLAASPYADRLPIKGSWLALEDIDEAEYRIDRQLAHLKLAGWFERCSGILLGDFHCDDRLQTAEVLEILKYHLPQARRLPIVVCPMIGHAWPMAPLPIGRKIVIRRSAGRGGRDVVEFDIPWKAQAVIGRR